MAYYYLDKYSVDFDDEEWCEQQAEEGIHVEPLGRREDGALVLDTSDGSIQYVAESLLNSMVDSGVKIENMPHDEGLDKYFTDSFVEGGVLPFGSPEKLARISLKKEYREEYGIDPAYYVYDIQMGLYVGRNVLFREIVIGSDTLNWEADNAKYYSHSFKLDSVNDFASYVLHAKARGVGVKSNRHNFEWDEYTSTPLRWVDMHFINGEKHPKDMKLGYKTHEPECYGMPVPSEYYRYLRDIRDRGEKQEFLSAIPQELYTNEFAPTLKYYDVEFYK